MHKRYSQTYDKIEIQYQKVMHDAIQLLTSLSRHTDPTRVIVQLL